MLRNYQGFAKILSFYWQFSVSWAHQHVFKMKFFKTIRNSLKEREVTSNKTQKYFVLFQDLINKIFWLSHINQK